jgi:hypothetical protein
MAVVTAAIPLEKSTASSVLSSAARRRSTSRTVGLP